MNGSFNGTAPEGCEGRTVKAYQWIYNYCVTLRGRFKEAARNINRLKPYRAFTRVSECFN